MNTIFNHPQKTYIAILIIMCCCFGCSPAEDIFTKGLKDKLLGTWATEQMLVLRWNNAMMRWDTIPIPATVTPSVLARATVTFKVDGTYGAFDPTIDRSINPRANRGQIFAVSPRFDFAGGWSINTPLGGIWEFVDNYTTLHLDKGNPEGNGFPPEKWIMEELTDRKLRLYKNAPTSTASALPLRVWYTFGKRE
jgi:hypothetical protein